MIVNDEKYYVIFYDNVQLTENDQNKYKIFCFISEVAIFEHEIKIISNVFVLYDLKSFNNKKKKDVAIFFSRKNIATPIKKKSKRFFKKKRRFDRFQQKQKIFDSNEFFKNSKIVMNDVLFIKQNFNFLRISSRRKILIQIFKTRYDLFQSNNKKQTVFSSTSFAKLKKRFVIFINDDDDDENNKIRTFIKIFKFVIKQKIEKFLFESQSFVIKNQIIFQKFVIKQKIENFLIESQLFVIKNRILFQKFSFKRSSFDNLIFTLIRVII